MKTLTGSLAPVTSITGERDPMTDFDVIPAKIDAPTVKRASPLLGWRIHPDVCPYTTLF